MTISHIVIVSVPLAATVGKYSFLGLFRFGPQVIVNLKVCCDASGTVFYKVVNGPPGIKYDKVLGEKYDQAANEALKLWNESRRKPRMTTKIKISSGPENAAQTRSMSKSHLIAHRSVRGILKVEALVPKTEEVKLPPLKPYEKQKTIVYTETDVSFGDTSKIYARQTHIFRKGEESL